MSENMIRKQTVMVISSHRQGKGGSYNLFFKAAMRGGNNCLIFKPICLPIKKGNGMVKNNQTREAADTCSNIFLCLLDSDWLRTVSINH